MSIRIVYNESQGYSLHPGICYVCEHMIGNYPFTQLVAQSVIVIPMHAHCARQLGRELSITDHERFSGPFLLEVGKGKL